MRGECVICQDLRLVPLRKHSFLERYGSIARHLRQLREAVDMAEENKMLAGGEGCQAGAESVDGSEGNGARVGRVCADVERLTRDGLLSCPEDMYLHRAQALIFRCKSRLHLHSEQGNNDALALAHLRKALVISKGNSFVTALEIGDAVHEAAWRYESDLSTGPEDTPHSYLTSGQAECAHVVRSDAQGKRTCHPFSLLVD